MTTFGWSFLFQTMTDNVIVFMGDTIIDTILTVPNRVAGDPTPYPSDYNKQPVGCIAVKCRKDDGKYSVYFKRDSISGDASDWVIAAKRRNGGIFSFEDLPLSEIQKAQILLVS